MSHTVERAYTILTVLLFVGVSVAYACNTIILSCLVLSSKEFTMKHFTQVILAFLSVGYCGAWSFFLMPRTATHQQRFTSGSSSGTKIQSLHVGSTLRMTESSETPSPTTFREAEVLGLRLMQEGNYQEALDGTFSLLFFRKQCEVGTLHCARAHFSSVSIGSLYKRT